MSRTARLTALAAILSALAAPSHAAIISYKAFLDGPSENPPNVSLATGVATIKYDDVAHTLQINASWSGLLGTTTAAHIHCCVASPGVAPVVVSPVTLPGFPLVVTAGTYAPTPLDLTNIAVFSAAFVSTNGGTASGAENALITAFNSGQAYLNIHTTVFPGGEIRGFLQVPEPTSMALTALALAGLGWSRRRIAVKA